VSSFFSKIQWLHLADHIDSFVEFESAADLKSAVEKLEGRELKGSRVTCTADVRIASRDTHHGIFIFLRSNLLPRSALRSVIPIARDLRRGVDIPLWTITIDVVLLVVTVLEATIASGLQEGLLVGITTTGKVMAVVHHLVRVWMSMVRPAVPMMTHMIPDHHRLQVRAITTTPTSREDRMDDPDLLVVTMRATIAVHTGKVCSGFPHEDIKILHVPIAEFLTTSSWNSRRRRTENMTTTVHLALQQ
jgi:hypothetical protein